MTKSGGLGSLPQGLEWITKKKTVPQDQSQKNDEPLIKEEVIAKDDALLKQVEPAKSVDNKQQEIAKSIQSDITISETIKEVEEITSATIEESISLNKSIKPLAKRALRSASIGLQEGFTRATFIIKEEHIEKLKALAYVKQTPIKDIVDQAMTRFLRDKNVADILSEAINNKAKICK